MGYIQPNSIVHILKGVPLDETYENTIYFGSESAQYSYFYGKKKYSFDTGSNLFYYQRVNLNTIRVNRVADELYDCNYLMFKNTRNGISKWFYAFIKEVNYINEAVSEIVYEIDVMQTWHFEYVLEECFVEREHADHDAVGDNLQDENLPTGEYVYGSDFAIPSVFQGFDVVMTVSYEPNTQTQPIPISTGHFYNTIYSGCYCRRFQIDASTSASLQASSAQIKSAIESYATIWGDRSDSIISIYMYPSHIPATEDDPLFQGITVTRNRVDSGNIFGGYTPHNKKLYTYPYNFLYVTNFQDVSEVFPYEYFDSAQSGIYFIVTGNITGQPSVVTYPRYYKGLNDNKDEIMTLQGYPQCAFNTDAFKAWLAQMKAIAVGAGIAVGATALAAGATMGVLAAENVAIEAGTMAAHSGVAEGMAKVSKGMASGLQKSEPILQNIIGNKLREGVNAFKNPIRTHGQQNGSSLMAANCLAFAYGNKHIRREYAERIDEYFDLYGYATNRVKIPNRYARTYWTYTKTIGCAVKGDVPKDASNRIAQIFDKGIRFWAGATGASIIGEYSTYRMSNNVLI